MGLLAPMNLTVWHCMVTGASRKIYIFLQEIVANFIVDARNMKTVALNCIVLNSWENVTKIKMESEKKVLTEAKKMYTSLYI